MVTAVLTRTFTHSAVLPPPNGGDVNQCIGKYVGSKQVTFWGEFQGEFQGEFRG